MRSFLPKSRAEKLVNGLREGEKPGAVRVFRARADGTPGRFLRYETAGDFNPKLHKTHNPGKGGMKFLCRYCPAEFKQLKELVNHYEQNHVKKVDRVKSHQETKQDKQAPCRSA